MADTLTSNYSWVKPEPGASPTTWGAKINSDLDGIDAQVHTAQTAANVGAAGIVPIGGIVLWGTITPPANYFLCDGTVRANTAAPALAALFGTTFGGAAGATFGVPDMKGNVPIGYLSGDPSLGILGNQLGAAIDAGVDFAYVVLNYIVRYQ